MNPVHRIASVLGLVLLLASGWVAPAQAQPVPEVPEGIEVVRAEVPRAVVPDRPPVVPAPTQPAQQAPDRLDRTDDLAGVVLAAPVRWGIAPPMPMAPVVPTSRVRLHDVLMVYRI